MIRPLAINRKKVKKATKLIQQKPVLIMLTLAVAFSMWELIWFLTGGIGFAHSTEVALYLGGLAWSPIFWLSIAQTLVLTLIGLAGGVVLSTLIGVPIGSAPNLEASSRGVLVFSRAIPSVALIPLLMAAIGSRTVLVIWLVTWLVTIKMVFFVIRGVRDLDQTLHDQSRLLQLGWVHQFFLVRLPAASAIILTGARLSVNRAYGAVLLAGLLAGTPGIGREIQLARFNSETLAVLSYTVVAALVGLLLFRLFQSLENRFIAWRPAG